MTIEVKVPQLPESIADATVSTWHKKEGDTVSRDENLVDLETDKVMLEVPSPIDGVIKQIVKPAGTTVKAQEVLVIIEPGSGAKTETPKEAKDEKKASAEEKPAEKSATPPPSPQASNKEQDNQPTSGPSARRAAAEHEIDLAQVKGTGKGGRITKENVLSTLGSTPMGNEEMLSSSDRPEKRVPMSRMRARIAERLLEVTQTTAMLTTFNEVNMAEVMAIRSRYKEKFEKKYKVRLGFMSFFVRAVVEALKRSPIVNASIDGNDVVYHGYYDIGVAVSTERGLVVPVLRNADKMSMAEIEAKIGEAAEKARAGKLTLEEMQGGTFTITNGGVFGSLMATPLLNAPQCGILGMHKIEDRPVVEHGQIVIRPMMYVALSYDHRLIDGKESVTFLVSIKEMLEDPTRMVLEI
ncbi:MAG: 2-oxoglutarate dehydrogenase complex dihydrolipoyllysine-residue succinyltransferase [Gammaproteobacteria bacterium]|nr:2-oxoglutarate dehydrogenase complex dihydrolipoyllysine-residue succinyltransferase [Gammaproteobacteria bacterium]